MPNLRSFMREGVHYPRAHAYLSSATDMNRTNALAGTYTGTQGLYMVGGTWRSFTEHDEVITAPHSMELMHHGPEGKPIQRIFDVAKKETREGPLWFLGQQELAGGDRGGADGGHRGPQRTLSFFLPPTYRYLAAGDPPSDTDPGDPLSDPFSTCFYSDTTREVIIPALLGQFNLLLGLGLYIMPVSLVFDMMPGGHCEDRYFVDSFLRSIAEEDPDVRYINIADLDNTGLFAGCS